VSTNLNLRWWQWALPLLLLPGFFVSFDLDGNVALWHALMDLSHLLIFFFFAHSFYPLMHRFSRHYAALTTSTLCVFLMLLIEWLQPLAGRSSSIQDIYFGLLGVSIWLLTSQLWPKLHEYWQRLLVALLILIIVVASGFTVIQMSYAVFWRMQKMPMLGDFEREIDLILWHAYGSANGQQASVQRSADVAHLHRYSLKVNTIPSDWSGVQFFAGDMDWSTYQRLSLAIYNPGKEMSLGLRIDDAGKSDEFNSRINSKLILNPGWNEIVLSLPELSSQVKFRAFDLANIRMLYLFTSPRTEPKTFFVDNVRLD